MSYGTWLVVVMASVVSPVDAELAERLQSLWRRIAELVASFFGPRGIAGQDARVRA
jgi:hypothetical protein